MSTTRNQHTATLLDNGLVLVVGGLSLESHETLKSAELYDPSAGEGAGEWSPTGRMINARYNHTATLLPDGKVLIAGGFHQGSTKQAEIYDPETGKWTKTAHMKTQRHLFTATFLSTNEVLVAGGVFVNRSELFAPSQKNGRWRITGSMIFPRHQHTATLLTNGKVLVTGGRSGQEPSKNFFAVVDLETAELYDPVPGSWMPTASMSSARWVHTATLLTDGTVLVTGGINGGATAELYK